jgi:hypothetical protein
MSSSPVTGQANEAGTTRKCGQGELRNSPFPQFSRREGRKGIPYRRNSFSSPSECLFTPLPLSDGFAPLPMHIRNSPTQPTVVRRPIWK